MIAVTNGSACTSFSIEPSHVLTAMGQNEIEAFSSLRFSLGKNHSENELDIVIDSIKVVIENLRLMVSH